MPKRRIMALILAMTLLFSTVSFADAPGALAWDSGTDIGALDSGEVAPRQEPNYYDEAYADYLAQLDAKNAEQGNETQYWMDYMVKWGKAVWYEETPDDYIYKEPRMGARAATITVKDLPLGAKVVDPTTKWGSEPMIWIKASDNVHIAGTATFDTTTYRQRSYLDGGQQQTRNGPRGGNRGAMYFYSEKSIASLPNNTTPTSGVYMESMLQKWLNENNQNHFLGMSFYGNVLSPDLKKNMHLATMWHKEIDDSSNDSSDWYWIDAWVGLPFSPPCDTDTYIQDVNFTPYATQNKLTSNGYKYSYFPIQGNNQGSWTIDNGNRITINFAECLWSYRHGGGRWDNNGNQYPVIYPRSYSSGGGTYERPGTTVNYSGGYDPPGERSAMVKPVIALMETTKVAATPDSNGVYTMITSDFCDTPQLIQTVDASLGTILTAYSSNAAGIKLYNGSTQVHAVSGTSLVYKVNAAGTYKATASKGSYSANSNIITISNVASAKPVVNISYQDGAQAWAASVKVFFSVSEVANGSALKPGASVTVRGPSGAVAATHTGNGNYNFTATANGTYTVSATISGQSASGSTAVSKIDVTAPVAPSMAKYPNTTYHNDNVVVTIAGGSDAGSGIKGYQYRVGGGVWTNGASVSVASSSTVYGRTVDNVGKVSGESSIAVKINRVVPGGTVSASTSSWTDKTVTLSFAGSDAGGSGVKRVRPTGGSWVNGSTCTQTVSANGTYYFEVENNAGGVGTVSKSVTNIDTEAPTVGDVSFIKAPATIRSVIFGQKLEINLSATDSASGVRSIEYQLVEDGQSINPSGWLKYNNAARPVIERNFTGLVAVRSTDNVGRISEIKTANVVVEDVAPTASHMLTPDSPTNGTVTIKVTATDTSGITSIQLPDGTVVSNGYADFTVASNNTYTFIVTDKCGNTLDYAVEVSNIDIVAPTATHTLLPDGWTNADVVIEVKGYDDYSGVASIKLPDGVTEPRDIVRYTATANGDYAFVITDAGGNSHTYTVAVTGIDRVKPEITSVELVTVPAKLRNLFRKKVELHAAAKDDYSGVANIEYQMCEGTEQPHESAWKRYNANSPPSWNSDLIGTVYVRAVDNAANPSSVTELPIHIDMTAPVLGLTAAPSTWTNADVTIMATFEDDSSGIQSITLPSGRVLDSGEVLDSGAVNYTVTENGTYPFSATDVAGNSTTDDITVDWIDRTAPAITRFELVSTEDSIIRRQLRGMLPSIFNKQVELVLEAEDDYSGVGQIEYQIVKDGDEFSNAKWKDYRLGIRLEEEANVTVYARVLDSAANISSVVSRAAIIDGSGPTAIHTITPDYWTKGEATITVVASDSLTDVVSITLPDGTIAQDATARYTVTANGSYSFVLLNAAEVPTVYTVVVSNIDPDLPTPPKLDPPTVPDSIIFPWSKEPETLQMNASSIAGVEKYLYSVTQLWPLPPSSRAFLPETAEQWNESLDGIITVDKEGVHSLTVRTVSISGAVSHQSSYTLKNDFTAPVVEAVAYSRSIHLVASDALSGVDKIVCEHGEMLGNAVNCPMLQTEAHHYDVYDKAGNVTAMDVDFVFVPHSDNKSDWVPDEEPDNINPGDVPIVELPVTENPLITDDILTEPRPDTSVLPDFTPPSAGGIEGNGSEHSWNWNDVIPKKDGDTISVFGRELTPKQFLILQCAICSVLWLVVLIVCWFWLKHRYKKTND